jgi:hypothetical protein
MQMIRLTVAFALVLGAAAVAHAQAQADIANQLNEQGKAAMYKNDYPAAIKLFRDAVARVPEPKYFNNLCTALFQDGQFEEAVVACKAVLAEKSGATPEQRDKAEKLIARINSEATAQGKPIKGTGGGGGPGDPNDCANHPENPGCSAVTPPPPAGCPNPENPACTQQPVPPPAQPARYRPPTQNLTMAVKPDNHYTWTLGADFFVGGGKIGQDTFYGSNGNGFRIKADYMLNQTARFGAQGYIGLTHFGPDAMNDSAFADTLDVFDLGIALYKHLCPRSTQRLCLTPLAGVQLALMSPAGEMDAEGGQVFNYAAVGARLELGLEYAFGYRQQHVLTGTFGATGYSAAFSDPADGFSRFEVGLDKGGGIGYVGLGYMYRFNTPLGSSPFVTLE